MNHLLLLFIVASSLSLLVAANETKDAIQLVCGGALNLPDSPADVIVEYRFNQSYGNVQYCMWPLTASNRWENATVTLESHGFLGQDGLDAYYLNSTSSKNAGLNHCELSTECTLQNGLGFIAFSSGYGAVGTGFRLRIKTTTATNANSSDSVHVLKDDNGTFRFPANGAYRNNERSLILIQKPWSHQIWLSSLDTERNHDYVYFFVIYGRIYNPVGDVGFDSRWSGYFSSGIAASLSYAVQSHAILFISDNTKNGAGFEIGWETNTEPRSKPIHQKIH